MKKFRHRLSFLLKMKTHLERERQQQLAEALRKVVHQRQTVEKIAEVRDGTLAEQRSVATKLGAISVSKLSASYRFLGRLRSETLANVELLKGLEQRAEVVRLKVVEATKERKIQQRLYEQAFEKYKLLIRAEEQKMSDEIALQSYSRRHVATR